MFAIAGVPVNIEHIKTDRLRKQDYQTAGVFVPPTQVKLLGNAKACIIKLSDLLQNLLSHPEIVAYVRNPCRPQNDSVFEDFRDGAWFQSHPIFEKHEKNIILLNLYYDDIELANPIGTKRGNPGKLGVFLCYTVELASS